MNKNLFAGITSFELTFYCVTIVFSLFTFFFNVPLAIAEIVVIAAYIITQMLTLKRRNEQLYSYLQSITLYLDEASRESLTRFPMPVTLLSAKGDIIWYNDLFHDILVENKMAEVFGKNFDVIAPGININAKNNESVFRKHDITFLGRNYSLYLMRQDESNNKEIFYSVYWIDQTQNVAELQKLRGQRLCIAYILIDSYDELPSKITELQKATFITRVDVKIRSFANSIHGVLQKIETDKYLIIFEQKYLEVLEKNKFKILDESKEIVVDGYSATLSIGLGFGTGSPNKADASARAALDMALSRGGDQAVLTNGDKYKFYGGNSDGAERNKRVKVRIIAEAFSNQVMNSDNVIIMGHKYADLDCAGAAIGVARCVAALGGTPYIIYNSKENLAKSVFEMFLNKPGYEDWFVEPAHIARFITESSLLVVVDTHNKEYVESEKTLSMIKNVMFIDHHRKVVQNAIDNAIISFHEPNSSSTCEMVSELCENIKKCKITKQEANALMAGIFLDTKTFSERTGVRTFEAAAFLKRQGADTSEVKQFFKYDLESYKKQLDIMGDATIIGDDTAISIWRGEPFTGIKVIAAKAADELLNINHINYSYVIYPEDGLVHISARSAQKGNVQRIMEQLGGGGHRSAAGAQIKDASVQEVYDQLVKIIKEQEEQAK